jgi:hypothetical protein
MPVVGMPVSADFVSGDFDAQREGEQVIAVVAAAVEPYPFAGGRGESLLVVAISYRKQPP